TGWDIWTISRALHIPPWAFTIYGEAQEGAEAAFVLDHSGQRFEIALAKRLGRGKKNLPCIFLWRLPDGHAQCGLGSLRPVTCQSYPALLLNGLLCVRNGPGCGHIWSLSELDMKGELTLLEEEKQRREEYKRIVEELNAAVLKSPEGTALSYPEYCNYLINAYADLYGGKSYGG
ncbi:MAG: hypothetical protein HY783_08725, partial [Chloroflexi bacterium]|nr:hypothetical protein [Chloroflexota bacterium]